MKKVLSVLLAAAMVMGMSVTSFAANYTWDSKSTDDSVGEVDSVWFPDYVWHMKDGKEATKVDGSNTIENLEPGDNLYFPLYTASGHEHSEECLVLKDEANCEDHIKYAHESYKFDTEKGYFVSDKNGTKSACHELVCKLKLDKEHHPKHTAECYGIKAKCTCKQTTVTDHTDDCYELGCGMRENGPYSGKIDSDWSINIEGTEYVQTAYYVAWVDNTIGYSSAAKYLNSTKYEKFVCVELVDDLDETADKTVSFEMYLDDDQYINCVTNTVIFDKVKFANYNELHKVSFTKTNNVDEPAVWAVAKNAKGEATFDFADEAFFTVKMYSEEKVTFNFSQTYDKAVDKLFDYEVAEFYNFKGSKDAFSKVGELFIPADEDTFIYEIVDGKAVEVEAEYVEDYTITNVQKKHSGWLIETDELGYYVVSNVEIEVEAEEPAEEPVEADKANPETGAADFVGAAVAMAVVSVAAAGALALKK